MSRANGVKNKIAGKAKQVLGEVLGDQDLHEEGKDQEREGREEVDGAGSPKPLGNLDNLT